MKRMILIITMVLFAASELSAMTIDAAADLDTVYKSPSRISKTFGKLPTSEDYGIFVNITCKAEEGESEYSSLFYRLSSGIEKDGKTLYTMIDGQKVMLAEKKWLGWKVVDGVKIEHSLQGKPYPTCKVWVAIE